MAELIADAKRARRGRRKSDHQAEPAGGPAHQGLRRRGRPPVRPEHAPARSKTKSLTSAPSTRAESDLLRSKLGAGDQQRKMVGRATSPRSAPWTSEPVLQEGTEMIPGALPAATPAPGGFGLATTPPQRDKFAKGHGSPFRDLVRSTKTPRLGKRCSRSSHPRTASHARRAQEAAGRRLAQGVGPPTPMVGKFLNHVLERGRIEGTRPISRAPTSRMVDDAAGRVQAHHHVGDAPPPGQAGPDSNQALDTKPPARQVVAERPPWTRSSSAASSPEGRKLRHRRQRPDSRSP